MVFPLSLMLKQAEGKQHREHRLSLMLAVKQLLLRCCWMHFNSIWLAFITGIHAGGFHIAADVVPR